MATPLDLPLPEVTVKEFHRAWTRFELVAKAKEWDEARQKLVLPTLLCGKLVEYYTEADEETRGKYSNHASAFQRYRISFSRACVYRQDTQSQYIINS